MTASPLIQTGQLLDSRDVSAVELLEDTLELIDRVDPQVHAWTTIDHDDARRAAVVSDHRAGEKRRSVVDGIPIGIKDLIDTQGLRTTYGSSLFEQHVPERDAHVVSRLRQAGAVIVGKTVTTQFATYDPSETRNPWDLECTPGGSSAGSAAAVAAEMVPAAIGTQTGGSTIRPASYCGVVGYMPSPGWIGRSGVFPCAWSLDRVGLFASSIADVDRLLDVCLGKDHTDPISRAVRRRPVVTGSARVAVLSELVAGASPDMRHAVGQVTDLLTATGAEITEVTLHDLELAHVAHATIMRAEIAAVHADLYKTNPETYAPEISALITTGLRVKATDYLRALRIRTRFRDEIRQKQQRFDLMVAPAAVGEAEASLETTGSPEMNLLATFAGLPALSIPAGFGEHGLPLGVQLIGRANQDDALLATAAQLEERIAFRRPPISAETKVPPR